MTSVRWVRNDVTNSNDILSGSLDGTAILWSVKTHGYFIPVETFHVCKNGVAVVDGRVIEHQNSELYYYIVAASIGSIVKIWTRRLPGKILLNNLYIVHRHTLIKPAHNYRKPILNSKKRIVQNKVLAFVFSSQFVYSTTLALAGFKRMLQQTTMKLNKLIFIQKRTCKAHQWLPVLLTNVYKTCRKYYFYF